MSTGLDELLEFEELFEALFEELLDDEFEEEFALLLEEEELELFVLEEVSADAVFGFSGLSIGKGNTLLGLILFEVKNC